MMFRFFIAFMLLLSWICTSAVAAPNPAEIAKGFGWSKISEVRLDGPIEAAAAFHCGKGCTTQFVIPEQGWGTYLIFRATDEGLELARWDEAAGFAWQRDLEFPIFISLQTSTDGQLVAACTWEEESVLGFVFDHGGAQRFREPLDPLSQLAVFPDGSAWSVTWAMFDWPQAQSTEAPAVSMAPECAGGKWNKKPLASGETVWWYRPLHHPREAPHPALCYPAFALTDQGGAILFSEQENGSFVTFFADVVCGEDKLVLVNEGEDAVGNQAREMIALSTAGEELWRVRAHRQSSQVSGFLHGQDLVLLFVGKDIEYRNATNGALIASDTLKLEERERLFPIQGFLHNDEGFLVLGRQLSIHVSLNPGEGISHCEPLEMGGALSYDGKLCALYSTAPDSAARVCTLFKKAQ
ncbi:MAG: hypothetical protein V1784_11340 [bacterium]